jgi:hypothetical protein
MSNRVEKHGMGWIPDYPDFRDYILKGQKRLNWFLVMKGC